MRDSGKTGRKMKPKEKEKEGGGGRISICWLAQCLPDFLSSKLSCFPPDSNQGCKQLLPLVSLPKTPVLLGSPTHLVSPTHQFLPTQGLPPTSMGCHGGGMEAKKNLPLPLESQQILASQLGKEKQSLPHLTQELFSLSDQAICVELWGQKGRGDIARCTYSYPTPKQRG